MMPIGRKDVFADVISVLPGLPEEKVSTSLEHSVSSSAMTHRCNITNTEISTFRAQKLTDYFRWNEWRLSVAGSVKNKKRESEKIGSVLIPTPFDPLCHLYFWLWPSVFAPYFFRFMVWTIMIPQSVWPLRGHLCWGHSFLYLQGRGILLVFQDLQQVRGFGRYTFLRQRAAVLYVTCFSGLRHMYQVLSVLKDGSGHWVTKLTRILIYAIHLFFV